MLPVPTMPPVDAVLVAKALGIKVRAVQTRAAAEHWPYTTTPGRGGHKRWYARTALPMDVRDALSAAKAKAEARERARAAAHARSTDVAASGPVAAPLVMRGQVRRVADAKQMTDRDRAVTDASLLLCQAADEAMAETGCSARAAGVELASRICDGRAYERLVHAARVTYLRPRHRADDPQRVGGQAALALRLQRLYGFYRRGVAVGDPCRFLVPAWVPKRGELVSPIHRAAFLRHYCLPSRPTVISAWRSSAPWYAGQGLVQPAHDTFERLQRALPLLVKERGRMTGSAWRSLKPYTERDVSMFHANDIWVGDGHTFKATVQSPIHGRAFRPEVTVVLDWVSRKVVGWSVDLAESTIAVSAAFRDAQLRTRARPLVYYSDNGSGQTGKFIDCDVHGTLARQGIAHETGIPGNPQGRGVIERLWASTTIALASTYPTFAGKRADPEHVRVTSVAVAKAQRAGGFSPLVPKWDQFLAELDKAFGAYNARVHSGVGGVPDQVYAARMDADSLVFGAGDGEIETLWMPEARRTPRRGLIELFGNVYFLSGLAEVLAEGDEVRVRFDIHRAEHVWVLDMDGRMLGRAQWNSHKRAAFPVAYIEAKRAERVERKVAKKLGEADQARDELTHTVDAPALELPQLGASLPGLDTTGSVYVARTSPSSAGGDVRLPGPPSNVTLLESNEKLRAMEARARAARG